MARRKTRSNWSPRFGATALSRRFAHGESDTVCRPQRRRRSIARGLYPSAVVPLLDAHPRLATDRVRRRLRNLLLRDKQGTSIRSDPRLRHNDQPGGLFLSRIGRQGTRLPFRTGVYGVRAASWLRRVRVRARVRVRVRIRVRVECGFGLGTDERRTVVGRSDGASKASAGSLSASQRCCRSRRGSMRPNLRWNRRCGRAEDE